MNDKQSKLILDSGEELILSQVRKRTPHDFYNSDVHIQFCSFIADKMSMVEDRRKICINLLSTRSTYIKEISSLIYFLKQYEKNVVELWLDNFSADFVQSHFPDLVVKKTLKNIQLISTKYISRYFFRMIVHKLFRIVRLRRKQKETIILKTWVEESLRFFPKECKQGLILVLPFPLSIKRQLAYIKQLKKLKYRFSLYGVPYSLCNIMKIMTAVFFKEKILNYIINIEYAVNRRMVKELIQQFGMNFQYFTNDEFEFSMFLSNKLLNESANIPVTNVLHGVGVYGPYIYCTKLKVHRQFQINFYQKYSDKNLQIEMFPVDFYYTVTDNTIPFAIVYMHQNFEESGLCYEDNLQQIIINSLMIICKNLGMKLNVKLHPNTHYKNRKKFELLEQERKISLYSNDMFKRYLNIFVNYNSTSYYDFSQYGVTVFIKHETYEPKEYFGHWVLNANVDELQDRLSMLLDRTKWFEVYHENMHYLLSLPSLQRLR